MPCCSLMIAALVLKNSSVTGASFSIPSSCVRRVYSRQSAKSTVSSERRPASQCNSHRLQRFGFESLRRTPRSHHTHPMSPVKGTPSARHLGDSEKAVDTDMSLVNQPSHK
jgi:hypothetical protein